MQLHLSRFFHAALLATAGAAAFAAAPTSARAQTPAPIELQLPIDCTPGEDCWVVNYVDDDPSEKARDFNCGPRTYNGHKGTDIAVRDLAVMESGVPVLAAADGTVVALRDGMDDVNVDKIGAAAIRGKECGNGVIIRHAGGWMTQYCHMQKGSLVVEKGQEVLAGERIGYVGLSGKTQFPHVHIGVRLGKKIVDPFVGLTRRNACGVGEEPLWNRETLQALKYQPAAIYMAGFSGNRPDARKLREQGPGEQVVNANAPALVMWADIYGVQAGDTLDMQITGPDGRSFLKTSKRLNKTRAREFRYVGKRNRSGAWPAGTYRGEIKLTRKTANGDQSYSIERTAEVR